MLSHSSRFLVLLVVVDVDVADRLLVCSPLGFLSCMIHDHDDACGDEAPSGCGSVGPLSFTVQIKRLNKTKHNRPDQTLVKSTADPLRSALKVERRPDMRRPRHQWEGLPFLFHTSARARAYVRSHVCTEGPARPTGST